MKELFEELTENAKIIYDDDNFAYMKCEDVEAHLLEIDKTAGSGDCVQNGFKFISKYLSDLQNDVEPFSHLSNELRKLEGQTEHYRCAYRYIKAVDKSSRE